MAARFAFRRLSTQVMKQVTSAEGPVVSKGRLPLRPRGNLAAPQARNASGAASEGSGTDTAGARSKGTTGKDVNVSNSRWVFLLTFHARNSNLSKKTYESPDLELLSFVAFVTSSMRQKGGTTFLC